MMDRFISEYLKMLICVNEVQECDATTADSSTKADKLNIFLALLTKGFFNSKMPNFLLSQLIITDHSSPGLS